MTRNQKIALGCGGAGCLGLIVVVVAGCFLYFFTYSQARYRARDYEFPVNVNANSNTSSDSNANVASNSNSDSSDSSLSEDDKHKLYQAASMTGDPELIRRVTVKLGLMNEDYTPSDHYQQFIAAHVGWAIRNRDFIQSIDTPDKARAYVNDHFPE